MIHKDPECPYNDKGEVDPCPLCMGDDEFRRSVLRAYFGALDAWQAHETHPVAGAVRRIGRPTRQCKVDTVCDEVADAMREPFDELFKPEDAETWLGCGPGDLLEWGVGDAPGESIRDMVAGALRSEAEALIFPVTSLGFGPHFPRSEAWE